MKNEKQIVEDCLFCNIVKGNILSNKISESDFAYAFSDINPQAPIHALVIPKIHIPSVAHLDETNINFFGEMALLANDVLKKVDTDGKGFRWVLNAGDNGGQTVDHIHLHLLAGRKLIWPPG